MDLNNLSELGLSNGQIKVYTAVLEIGISTLNNIQEKTGIERRNIYDILNKLIERGMISYTIEHGKRTYQCTHPNKILEEIKAKENSLKELESQIPDIKSLFDFSRPEIRAEVFRGNEVLKAVLNEALEYDATYWIGGNSGIEVNAGTGMKLWFKQWTTKRIQLKKYMYDLVDHGTYLEDYKPQDIKKHKSEFYKYCQLPNDLRSPMVILIFGDKVAQILWSKQSFAFVLESKKLRESFMKYFNYFWKDPY